MNLELEGMAGLSGDDDLSGGLAGTELTDAAMARLRRIVKADLATAGTAKKLLNQIQNSLALNRLYAQFWHQKFNDATTPNDTSKRIVASATRAIVALRAQGASE